MLVSDSVMFTASLPLFSSLTSHLTKLLFSYFTYRGKKDGYTAGTPLPASYFKNVMDVGIAERGLCVLKSSGDVACSSAGTYSFAPTQCTGFERRR